MSSQVSLARPAEPRSLLSEPVRFEITPDVRLVTSFLRITGRTVRLGLADLKPCSVNISITAA